MSRIASPAEKIMAVAATYKALWVELWGDPMAPGIDPIVQAQLLETATRIAMGTDTKDLGILSPADKKFVDPPEGTDPLHEVDEDELLWGPEGPEVGQVVTIAGTSMQTRWTGTRWEPVDGDHYAGRNA